MTLIARVLLPALAFIFVLLAFPGCGGGDKNVRPETNGILTNLKTVEQKPRVGFAVDETLLSVSSNYSAAWSMGYATNSQGFWAFVNSSDNLYSRPRKVTLSILKDYQRQGAEVYIVTVRPKTNSFILADYLQKLTGVPLSNIFFEQNTKTPRFVSLELDYYYSDSDRDMEEALSAGVRPVRILRPSNSVIRSRYNPGAYFEDIVMGSEKEEQ